MNAFTSTLRTTLRTTLPTRTTPRYLSTCLPSLSSTSSSPPSPLSSSPSSSSSSDGSSQLGDVIKQAQASKQTKQQQQADYKRQTSSSRYPSQRSTSSLYPQLSSSPSFRSAQNDSLFGRETTPEQLWSHAAPVAYSPSVTTTSARSFAVQGGNLARAYRNLNRVLNENQVRRELKRQERFEGPSDKRVRLNSERHRRRFKVAVGKAVSLAMRQKNL